VKLLYEGGAQFRPGELRLSDESLVGGQGALAIEFPGALAGGGNVVLWRGDNAGGQAVAGGSYFIKAELVDPFGQVSSLIRPVVVVPGGARQSLRIYNAAGELVRSLALAFTVDGAASLELEGGVYLLEIDPATGSAGQPLKIGVRGNAGAAVQAWDGLNDRGAPVASGTYTLQLVSLEGGGGTVVDSRSLSVLKSSHGEAELASALAWPCPVQGGTPLHVDFAPRSGQWVDAGVYTLSGEAAGQAQSAPGAGRLTLSTSGLASGIYLLELRRSNGQAILARRILKVAVIR
jgi:hypothetical protein